MWYAEFSFSLWITFFLASMNVKWDAVSGSVFVLIDEPSGMIRGWYWSALFEEYFKLLLWYQLCQSTQNTHQIGIVSMWFSNLPTSREVEITNTHTISPMPLEFPPTPLPSPTPTLHCKLPSFYIGEALEVKICSNNKSWHFHPQILTNHGRWK